MAEVKWIKIATDIFDDEKILMIEALPNAESTLIVWFKLLTFAGKQNNDGVFLMGEIPYTAEMLASVFRRDVNVVRMALSTLEKFKLIEVVDGVITIPNWHKHQSLDAYEKKKKYDRKYQQEKREKQKLLAHSKGKSYDESYDESYDVVFPDIEEEEEEDLDKDKENTILSDSNESDAGKPARKTVNYQKVADMYNSTCTSLPRLVKMSETRKKNIRGILKQYSMEELQRVFTMAEESDFLSGRKEDWSCGFDWLMKPANFLKVLEGNYVNREKEQSSDRWNREFKEEDYSFENW